MGWRHGTGLSKQPSEAFAIGIEIASPSNQVGIGEQHLDALADTQLIEERIVFTEVLDRRGFEAVVMSGDPLDQRIHSRQLAFNGQGEGMDRAFHPLEEVDPHQADQAFLTVQLAEHRFTRLGSLTVAAVVFLALIGEHVTQRCIGGEREAADFVVNYRDRRIAAIRCYVGFTIVRGQFLWETARLADAVVALNMLSRACDGEQIQQTHIIKAQHIEEALGGPAVGWQSLPLVEGCLG